MSPFASARMYMWAPSLGVAWRRFLATIVARAGVDVTVMDEGDPTPLDELWQRADMGCMFMCGYPWAMRRDRPRLLAAPVPSPPRYGDRPVYVTDFIVRADSAYTRVELLTPGAEEAPAEVAALVIDNDLPPADEDEPVARAG